jgi:NAD(P)-dependent dehydrogenase (short-subunit alcohol dehydrogenase family)
MELQGKVAIITGASSGIGAATARELARHGTTVVLAARRADQLQALATEIEQTGGRALTVPTDVSRHDELDRLVSTTLEAYGRIDVLVNNAGVHSAGSLFESDDAALQRIFDVNLLGPARCIRAVVPHMRRQGSGVIVNIGSVAGEVGTHSLYSATKFGLRGLNDALRRELRHDNIALVLIAPGFIRTAMTEGLRFPMPGPEMVAHAVADAIHRPRRKIFVPWFYAPLVYGAELLPWLADLVIGSRLFQRRYRERKTI